MNPLETLLLAVALAADAFSVAVASGPVCRGARSAFRLSFHFGLFQALMPGLGALAGLAVRSLVETVAPWIAFGLLAAIGMRMIAGALRGGAEDDGPRRDPSRGLSLVGLSVATSIDAFGAGVGLGITGTNLWLACTTIGVVTAALVLLGIRIGRLFDRRLGPWAEALGGCVLVALGVKLLP